MSATKIKIIEYKKSGHVVEVCAWGNKDKLDYRIAYNPQQGYRAAAVPCGFLFPFGIIGYNRCSLILKECFSSRRGAT